MLESSSNSRKRKVFLPSDDFYNIHLKDGVQTALEGAQQSLQAGLHIRSESKQEKTAEELILDQKSREYQRQLLEALHEATFLAGGKVDCDSESGVAGVSANRLAASRCRKRKQLYKASLEEMLHVLTLKLLEMSKEHTSDEDASNPKPASVQFAESSNISQRVQYIQPLAYAQGIPPGQVITIQNGHGSGQYQQVVAVPTQVQMLQTHPHRKQGDNANGSQSVSNVVPMNQSVQVQQYGNSHEKLHPVQFGGAPVSFQVNGNNVYSNSTGIASNTGIAQHSMQNTPVVQQYFQGTNGIPMASYEYVNQQPHQVILNSGGTQHPSSTNGNQAINASRQQQQIKTVQLASSGSPNVHQSNHMQNSAKPDSSSETTASHQQRINGNFSTPPAPHIAYTVTQRVMQPQPSSQAIMANVKPFNGVNQNNGHMVYVSNSNSKQPAQHNGSSNPHGGSMRQDPSTVPQYSYSTNMNCGQEHVASQQHEESTTLTQTVKDG